jgi:hypothetical protein
MLKKLIFATSLIALVFISSSLFSSSARAEETTANLIVPIGEIKTFEQASVPTYITTVYKWGIGAAALLAVLMLVVGGLQYVLAAGNLGTTEAAKQRMTSAILGVALLLGISLILRFLDPKLTFINLSGKQDLNYSSDLGWSSTSFYANHPKETKIDFSTEESLDRLRVDLDSLEQESRDGKISANEYLIALERVKNDFNEYFDSNEYKETVKRTAFAASRLAGIEPTEESLKKTIAEKKEAAWDKITDDMWRSWHYKDAPPEGLRLQGLLPKSTQDKTPDSGPSNAPTNADYEPTYY